MAQQITAIKKTKSKQWAVPLCINNEIDRTDGKKSGHYLVNLRFVLCLGTQSL